MGEKEIGEERQNDLCHRAPEILVQPLVSSNYEKLIIVFPRMYLSNFNKWDTEFGLYTL